MTVDEATIVVFTLSKVGNLSPVSIKNRFKYIPKNIPTTIIVFPVTKYELYVLSNTPPQIRI